MAERDFAASFCSNFLAFFVQSFGHENRHICVIIVYKNGTKNINAMSPGSSAACRLKI
jgi:hypothetical protein